MCKTTPSQVSPVIPGMTYIYSMHDYRAASPYQLDKPSETLQPKTSLETPRDLAIGQAVQEIQPFVSAE